jgi:hypothetical protein
MCVPTEEPNEDEDRDMAILDSHVAQLCEHFDTVQIFVTRQNGEENVTMTADKGNGNWYARYGQVREWITKQEERTKQYVRREE